MKAFQVWIVARESATLGEIARALLMEDDDRLACEAFNEKLTTSEKVALASAHFGPIVHGRRPAYLVQTLPSPVLAEAEARRLLHKMVRDMVDAQLRPGPTLIVDKASLMPGWPTPRPDSAYADGLLKMTPEELRKEYLVDFSAAPPCSCDTPDETLTGICPACGGFLPTGDIVEFTKPKSGVFCECAGHYESDLARGRCRVCGRAIK